MDIKKGERKDHSEVCAAVKMEDVQRNRLRQGKAEDVQQPYRIRQEKSEDVHQLNRTRQEKVQLLQNVPSEENLWQAIIVFQEYPFRTATGLPFQYKLKVGKNGEWNRELLIDRREKSKSLAWSSVMLAFEKSKGMSEEVKRPKALGDIRGISYIYPILWRFGMINVPEVTAKKMGID